MAVEIVYGAWPRIIIDDRSGQTHEIEVTQATLWELEGLFPKDEEWVY